MFIFIGVAFAGFSRTLSVGSVAKMQSHIFDYVYITHASISESSGATNMYYSFLDHELNATVSAPTCNSYVTYALDVINTTAHRAYFTSESVVSMINGSGNNTSSLTAELTNVTLNETSIAPHSTKTIYVKIKDGARFASERQNLNIFLSVNGEPINMGMIQLTVPKDVTLVDVTPPIVSNVIGTRQNNQGEVLVSFEASDDFGIHNFKIEVYKNNTLVDTKTIGPDVRSTIITNLEDGTYRFKVIAEDTSG